MAEIGDTAAGNAFLGAYEGTALDDLRAIACGNPYNFYPDTRLGFQAEAGVTYYIQVGNVTYDYYPPPLPGAEGDGGGFFPGTGTGILTLSVGEIELPPCGAPDFTFEDPVGDTRFEPPPPPPPMTSPDFPVPTDPFAPVAHDITSVEGGANDGFYCLTVNFDEPVDPPGSGINEGVYTYIDFDLDESTSTGYQGETSYACGQSARLGVDLGVSMGDSSGILVPLYTSLSPPGPDGGLRVGYALYGTRSVTLVVPIEALTVEVVPDEGGPEAFNFAVWVRSEYSPPSDCVPNGGFIHAPDPAHAGDINCDGSVNAIDTAVILQMVAGLLPGVPCPWVADVNGSGIIGPIDAQLILQYDAGMVDALPIAAG
jgi:hypothetical protein